jgi:hypothetical protein
MKAKAIAAAEYQRRNFTVIKARRRSVTITVAVVIQAVMMTIKARITAKRYEIMLNHPQMVALSKLRLIIFEILMKK